MRSYTISSSPSVPYSISITVKRVPGGRISNWLHDNLTEGAELVVHGPVGDFNVIDFPADKLLMLSGGVGITPIMSMTRWLFDTNANVDLIFVHSARTPKDIIYRHELNHVFSRVPNFQLNVVCERGADIVEPWDGFRGHMSGPMLDLMVPDLLEREVFCCGPAPYMNAVKSILKARGFDMRHYHDESFGATPAEIKEDVIELAEQAEVDAEQAESSDLLTVEFARSGRSAKIPPTDTVHTAAARAGLHIPKGCGLGICGTCRVELKSGKVVMNHNGGITEEDEADGFILSCCSRPTEAIVVDF